MIIFCRCLYIPVSIFYIKDGLEAVGIVFIGRENPEILCIVIQFENVTDIRTEVLRILAVFFPMITNVKGIVTEIRQPQFSVQDTTISMRIHTDAAVAFRCQCPQFREQFSRFIK